MNAKHSMSSIAKLMDATRTTRSRAFLWFSTYTQKNSRLTNKRCKFTQRHDVSRLGTSRHARSCCVMLGPIMSVSHNIKLRNVR